MKIEKKRMNRIETEKLTFSRMLLIYCRLNHHGAKGLCSSCEEMERYAHARLDHCIFGEDKPNCKNCSVHCYKPKMRLEAKKIMKKAGLHMIYRHPILAIKHILKANKK